MSADSGIPYPHKCMNCGEGFTARALFVGYYCPDCSKHWDEHKSWP